MPYRNKKTGETISDEEYKKRFAKPKERLYGTTEEMARMLEEEKAKGIKESKVTTLGVIKQVPKALVKIGIETPTKFVKSAVESPETILRGGKEPILTKKLTEKVPYMKKLPTYQEEAMKRVQKTEGTFGQMAWAGIGRALWEVPLAGLETMGLAKLGIGDYFITARPERIIKLPFGKTYTIAGHEAGELAPGVIPKGLVKAKEILTGFRKKQAINEAKDILTYKTKELTPTMKKAALKGKEGEIITKGKIFKKQVYEPEKLVDDAAEYLGERGIIKKNLTFDQNISKIDDEISRIATQEVRPYLKDYGTKITNKEMQRLLNQIDDIQPTGFTGEETATFNKMRQAVKDIIVDSSDDLVLYDKRIFIDDMLEQFKGGRVWDNNTNAGVNGVKSARKIINNFIADRLPDKTIYPKQMRTLSSLYEAKDVLVERGARILGQNWLQLLKKEHPLLTKGLKYTGIGTLLGGGTGLGYKGISRFLK